MGPQAKLNPSSLLGTCENGMALSCMYEEVQFAIQQPESAKVIIRATHSDSRYMFGLQRSNLPKDICMGFSENMVPLMVNHHFTYKRVHMGDSLIMIRIFRNTMTHHNPCFWDPRIIDGKCQQDL